MGRRMPAGLPVLAASYRVGAELVRALPERLRYAPLRPGGALWFWASRSQRRHALRNYAVALGRDPGDPEVRRVARRAFQNYGRMLADFVLIGGLTVDELRGRMSYDGRDHLDRALGEGRGVIAATPHMGSWDFAGSGGAAEGYPIAAVAERFPGSLDAAVVKTRQRFGLRVIPLGRSAIRRIEDALRQNSVVALLCDLPQGPGVQVELFGRSTTVPAGPATFALRTGARLMPACQWARGGGRYHVHLETPLEIGEGDDRRSLMQRVMHRFEAFIRERPDQWYAFRPMFGSEVD